MGTLYREATSIVVFTTLSNGSQFLKKNIITHLGFFPLRVEPLLKVSSSREAHRKSKICFPLCKRQINTHVYTRTSIPPASRCQNCVVILSRFATLHRRQTTSIRRQRPSYLCSNIEMTLSRRCRLSLDL